MNEPDPTTEPPGFRWDRCPHLAEPYQLGSITIGHIEDASRLGVDWKSVQITPDPSQARLVTVAGLPTWEVPATIEPLEARDAP